MGRVAELMGDPPCINYDFGTLFAASQVGKERFGVYCRVLIKILSSAQAASPSSSSNSGLNYLRLGSVGFCLQPCIRLSLLSVSRGKPLDLPITI
jgi:hypothetical protein